MLHSSLEMTNVPREQSVEYRDVVSNITAKQQGDSDSLFWTSRYKYSVLLFLALTFVSIEWPSHMGNKRGHESESCRIVFFSGFVSAVSIIQLTSSSIPGLAFHPQVNKMIHLIWISLLLCAVFMRRNHYLIRVYAMCVPFRSRNLDILNITVVRQIAKLGFRKCSDTVIVSTAS